MRRAVAIALLIFQSLWLNVVLPGHTRGAVTLPGYEKPSATSVGHGCCPTSDSDPSDSDKPDGRAAHCAVCFFAARLSLPCAIDLTPAPLGLCGEAPNELAESIASLDAQFTYLGRAPPIA
jgi:hypothetical protein